MELDPAVLLADDNTKIASNVAQFYKRLPTNSVIRSSAMQEFYADVNMSTVTSYLDLTERSIRGSRTVNAKPLTYYLTNLGIPRDRLGLAEDYAVDWLEMLQEPSGKTNKCYFGRFKSMYSDYFKWCLKKDYSYVSPSILDRIRRDRRIWLLKGDIFLVWFRLYSHLRFLIS